MPKFNDFDLTWEKWKEIELNMDSLWVINQFENELILKDLFW